MSVGDNWWKSTRTQWAKRLERVCGTPFPNWGKKLSPVSPPAPLLNCPTFRPCSVHLCGHSIILHKTRPNNRSLRRPGTPRRQRRLGKSIPDWNWSDLWTPVPSAGEFSELAKFHKTIDWSSIALQCHEKIRDKLGHQFDESWDQLCMKRKIAVLEFLKRRVKNKEVSQWCVF